jgi:hypothetical protein
MQNLIQAPVKRECIEWMGGGGSTKNHDALD